MMKDIVMRNKSGKWMKYDEITMIWSMIHLLDVNLNIESDMIRHV